MELWKCKVQTEKNLVSNYVKKNISELCKKSVWCTCKINFTEFNLPLYVLTQN